MIASFGFTQVFWIGVIIFILLRMRRPPKGAKSLRWTLGAWVRLLRRQR